MDYIRTPLIIALLVVSYLLILKWNEDFPSQPQVATNEPELNSTPIQDSIDPIAEDTLETDDFLTEPKNTSNSISVNEPSSSNQFVSVTTDVFNIKIDLLGGNLTYVSLKDYPVSLGSENSLELLVKDGNRHFLAKSGIIGKDGFDSFKNGSLPLYSVSSPSFSLTEKEDELVVDLKYSRDNVEIIKRYSFSRGNYVISLEMIVNNLSSTPWAGNFFANFERNSMPDPTSSGGFGAVSYLGAVVSTAEEKYEKVSFGDLDEQSAKFNDSKGWIAFVQHYFVSAWVPGSTEEEHSYQLRKKNQKYIMGYVDPSFSVSPNSTHSVGARLYLGPKILDTLQDVAPNLDLTIDFGILWIIAKPLFIVLDYIHSFIGNWGIAIILLTVLIKAIFFRLSAASYRSMANMRRVGPELQRIKELYGDDRQKLSQSMMELYKKEKINPLGGCLPMLVQMPVFIALYWVLLESVELRQAPFFFWIQDLSIKDPFFILPLAMGATMFLQMHLNPTPPDPMQARIMKLMPIVFTVFFLWFPAGLVLYWFVNNVLSIAQQWIITKNIEKQGLKTS